MATPNPETSSSAPTIVIRGIIDERIDLAAVVADGTREAEIRCRDVPRINSVGVANWYLHFQKLRKAGARLRFHEVSPALVRQLNYVQGFIQADELVSICIPYLCLKCGKEFVSVRAKHELLPVDGIPPGLPCPRCGSEAELDDIPSEYFSFVNQAAAGKAGAP